MRTGRWRRPAAVGAAACAMVVAGCGGGSGTTATEPPTAAETTAATGDEGGPGQGSATGADGGEAGAAGADGGTEAGADGGTEDAAGDFCGPLEEFYRLSVITMFGLAFEPGPEVVQATVQAGEVAGEVRPVLPAEIATDLEPMLVLAEDLAAAMDGVDPEDSAAVNAAAESVPGYLTQDEDLLTDVDAYTAQACSFTADSVAEEMFTGGAETTSSGTGGDRGTHSPAGTGAQAPPADCDRLDTDAILAALGGRSATVEQLGGNPEFTYQLGEEEFHGTSTACTVALGLSEHGPPEVRMRFLTMGADFYPRYRQLAQTEDAFTTATLTGADAFYYQETSFQSALVAELTSGHTLVVSASAGISAPAPDLAAMTTLGRAALAALG